MEPIYSWIVEIITSKVVLQRLIYQPRLQNRRLRVQVLVPLPLSWKFAISVASFQLFVLFVGSIKMYEYNRCDNNVQFMSLYIYHKNIGFRKRSGAFCILTICRKDAIVKSQNARGVK